MVHADNHHDLKMPHLREIVLEFDAMGCLELKDKDTLETLRFIQHDLEIDATIANTTIDENMRERLDQGWNVLTWICDHAYPTEEEY